MGYRKENSRPTHTTACHHPPADAPRPSHFEGHGEGLWGKEARKDPLNI